MSEIRQVTLSQLKTGMTIQAYLDMESKLGELNSKGCEWLAHNFPGTTVHAQRVAGDEVVSVKDVQPGDHVKKIEDFPNRLHHLVQVTPRLCRELKRQGLNNFMVRESTPEELRQQSARDATVFVKKVKEGSGIRDAATTVLETAMDNLGSGVTDLKPVEQMVDQMVASNYVAAMASIASLKQSDQTYAHCVDVGTIFVSVYNGIMRSKKRKSIFKDEKEALLCGLLHDLGKSKVPKEILEGTKRYDRNSPEMKALRAHPEHSIDLLRELGFPEYAVNMAGYHHVKLDDSNPSSYPEGLKFADAIYEARLLAIIDIYQALIGRRTYKKSWSAPAAIRYIDALSGVELDEDVWDDFVSVIGYYPVGSLVELDDGSLGFILKVPMKDLKSPQVVLVRDGNGDACTHTLIDLSQDKTKKIVKDHDPFEILGPESMDLYANLKPT